jgi:uncharacterized protein YbjT (DUF2867 family)
MNNQNNNKRFVLVTGVTGQQGGATAEALLARGHRVRGLTRNAASDRALSLSRKGVEIVEGDFTDADSILNAARGVDTLFAMTTPFEAGVEAETHQGLMLLESARQAGVGHFVYSSVASADQKTGIPHFESKFAVEKAIIESGIEYTILAPVFFMDNYASPWFAPDFDKGTISMPMKEDRQLQQISVSNIGAVAAVVIERRESEFGKRYDIAGDELTNENVARIISDACGRELEFHGFSPDLMAADNPDFAAMFDWFEETGYSVDIETLHESFPEVEWEGFGDWAKRQQWAVEVGS